MHTLTISGIIVHALSKGTNFDIRISGDEAARLIVNGSDGLFDIMCDEYGQDSDWVAVCADDLNEIGFFDPEYSTLEIWLNHSVVPTDLSYLPEAID